MSKLQNIPEINQSELLQHYQFAISTKSNCIVFGPSGSGKTECAIQACHEKGVQYVYWNLSVSERPDLQGIPKVDGDYVVYATPKTLPYGDVPKVIIFDETDKAPYEILQPLLELLQFRTINDKPLNIISIFLTGNLPDEFTNSEPISHAITNRCGVFELVPSLQIWVQWAIRNDIHPLITGFLSKAENAEFFVRPSRNNQMYCYAYPTPRSWTEGSRLLKALGKTEDSKFQYDILASRVGQEAAERLKVWINYYIKLEPVISDIFNGNDIDVYLEDDEIFVCAIGVLSRLNAWIKDKPPQEAQEKAEKVFLWTRNIHTDLQIAAYRGTCDYQLFIEKGFHSNSYLRSIWKEITNITKLAE